MILYIIFYGCMLSSSVYADFRENRGRSIFDIYWNSSNPDFEPFSGAIDSPGFWTITARAGDILKIHCPRSRIDGHKELLKVYKVSRRDFDQCSLSSDSKLVADCSFTRSTFTVKHTLRSQRVERDSFYLTTSNGGKTGVDQRHHGLCLEKNMRLSVHLVRRPHSKSTSHVVDDSQERRPPAIEPFGQSFYEHHSHGLLLLKEENGVLNWKKNVAPPSLQDPSARSHKVDDSQHPEPYSLDDERINRMEAEKGPPNLPLDVRTLDRRVLAILNNDVEALKNSAAGVGVIYLVMLIVLYPILL